MSRIDRVEVHVFGFEGRNLGQVRGGGVGAIAYSKGASTRFTKYAVIIQTADGLRGEYVTHWVASASALGQTLMLAPYLIGRDATQRELIYDDLKRQARQFDHMGHGPLDIALWDLAGKKLGASVSELLGGYRTRLPAYASTYHGDRNGGLDSKEKYAAFAEQCHAMGYRAFKIHGWNDGNPREEAANLLHVRKVMGDRMTLMIDPACELRTFADALYVGRACDEADYFWYEDPFRDSGTSAFAHRKLREMIRTPILQTEHVRGVEPKADFLVQGGTDFLRVDPEYDMGITGAMKIAHLGEAFGIDVEIHACGPAHRHCMSAMRNSNFYEVALVGPDTPNAVPPVYACGYSDQLDCVGADGCVPVPAGPGLGVVYDWGFIDANREALHCFD
ncbi:MAG: enolase C-terminal domain-like protein [Betaproteobacteria bacterium]|jgi:L-alanine-DL-glutamate epimerase-like enolase superfamily enzyme|nr:mandelate racemase [Rhodocyclaceae bacterium]MCE2898883.1 mandelate racemase [Betaproteobacteria bacterium]